MGGLFKDMKHTASTFIIASLAIAGIPPLSGFWSKDEILLTAYHSGNLTVYWLLVLIAFMTSFYMFRMVFMTFFGQPRDHHVHAHESPAVMIIPLWILAIGAIVVGFPGSPFMHHWFEGFILGDVEIHKEINWFVIGCSVAAATGGILLSSVMYLWKTRLADTVSRTFWPLYELSRNKFWIDEIYSVLFIRPFNRLAALLFSFDKKVVDGVVNGAGSATVRSSWLQLWFDKFIIDGLVNFSGHSMQILSGALRLVQSGFIQHYLLIAFISVLLGLFFELKY